MLPRAEILHILNAAKQFFIKKLITGHQKSIDNFGKGVPNLGDTKGIEVGNILVHGSLEGHKN